MTQFERPLVVHDLKLFGGGLGERWGRMGGVGTRW